MLSIGPACGIVFLDDGDRREFQRLLMQTGGTFDAIDNRRMCVRRGPIRMLGRSNNGG
jgi:hypothetical protein